jgi:hypothetical protein
MGTHTLDIVPFVVHPTPKPRIYERPTLLPGIWLEGIGSELGRAVSTSVGFDTSELHDLIVVDRPDYVHGMLDRLQREIEGKNLLDDLSQAPPEEWKQFYKEHPVEMEVSGADVAKLVFLASVLAGARSFVFHGPILVEKVVSAGAPDAIRPQSWAPEICRWHWPRTPVEASAPGSPISQPGIEDLDLTEVSRYCHALEPFFRPVHWHAGRLAVALGSLWACMVANDPAQSYLALMTVFEAIVSTEKDEISHQIAERTAFLLEQQEEKRYLVYRRMKQLYGTRSQVVHGDVDNRPGYITTDRLRLDTKITVVPKKDVADAFGFCIRLLRRVVFEQSLVALLQTRNSKKALNEYYLRLGFRSS